MKVRCLFFARLRDAAGSAAAEWEVPLGSVADSLWDTAPARLAGLEAHRAFTRIAVNGILAAGNEVLAEGDEVAFLPPVSGG